MSGQHQKGKLTSSRRASTFAPSSSSSSGSGITYNTSTGAMNPYNTVTGKSTSSSSSKSSAPAYSIKSGGDSEYETYLKSLNKKGSANSISTPDDAGMENMDAVNNAAVTGQATTPGYTGNSLVDALNLSGQSSDFASRTKLAGQYGIQGYTGTAEQNTSLLNKYRTGAAATKAAGTPVPLTQGSASSTIQNTLAPNPPDTSNIDTALEKDKGYQQLLKDRAEFTHVANQSTSLLDFYNQSMKDAGIPAINAELLNSKNIIDGTEDDIRSEVQAVSGFATDSQVLALAGARNKQLIKNYNNLLDTKQMAMENINTMVGLKKEDQQTALQNITEKLNIDAQLNTYRDKFVSNAKEGYANVTKAVGYAGLLQSLQKDPSSIPLVEKTLGLAPGGLQKLATYVAPLNAKDTADLALTNANIAHVKAETAKTYSDAAAAKASDAAVNPQVLEGMLNVYKSTGVLPTFGNSAKSPLRAQFYAALGGAGGNQIVTDANTNKTVRAGLTTAYKTQQNLLAANQTAIGTLDQQLSLAQSYRDKVGDSGSPLVNKYRQSLSSGVFGDPDTAALNNIVKTASYEFAKILSGAAASISGVTVNSAADAEAMLNGAMAKGQFNEVVNLMKKEADFRINSQKDTLTQLQKDMNNVNNLTESLKPVAPSDISDGYYQASDGLLYKK